jgi:DNA topoisomerase IB
MKKGVNYEEGTIRIKFQGLQPVIKTKKGWKNTNYNLENIQRVVELFKAHEKIGILFDSKDEKFLKGFLTTEGKIQGERVNILPDGRVLDKAYSLFSPHLTIHDETSNTHWDIVYQNPNGKLAYLYTLEKDKKSKDKKYELVKKFEKVFPTLEDGIDKALEKGEAMALPMETLIKTYMRVGNEIYYKKDGHKGLTTLKKKDIKIKNPEVTFSFIGKDGVPQKITKKFPQLYLLFLRERLNKIGKEDFVFADKKNKPLKDTDFEKAFKKYCGIKFYPHIVRSYYATSTAEKFLEKNKTPKKKEVIEMYKEIATNLGHKKFSKKKDEWQPSYSVTIAHYISPKIVEKIGKLIK